MASQNRICLHVTQSDAALGTIYLVLRGSMKDETEEVDQEKENDLGGLDGCRGHESKCGTPEKTAF